MKDFNKFVAFLTTIGTTIGAIVGLITGIETIMQRGGNLAPLLLNIVYQIGKIEFFMLKGVFCTLAFLVFIKFILFLLRSLFSIHVNFHLPRFLSSTTLFLGVGLGLYFIVVYPTNAYYPIEGIYQRFSEPIEYYYRKFKGLIPLHLHVASISVGV